MDMKITGINLDPTAADRPNKFRTIAHFDVDLGNVHLFGCALIVTSSGFVIAFPPSRMQASRKSVARWSNDATRDAVAAHALQAYRAIGGDQAPENPTA